MARFTNRQVDDAKRSDLAAFLRSKGEKLVKSGSEYRWVYRDGCGEHDSVTIRGSEWFDHKRQLGGDAIGFLQEFYNMSFRKAVEELIRQRPSGRSHQAAKSVAQKTETQITPFTLPAKAANMHRLYAYLCKTRGITPEVVSHFVHAGTLYEDAQYHNAVFVATDEQGAPRGGMKKGTLSGSAFRQTIAGSNTRYAFHRKGDSERLYVFEAAVDMLSFITLNPQNWQEHSYIALDGLSPKALYHFLASYHHIRETYLCLDNDMAGIEASKRISAQLSDKGYTEISTLLPERKDWNEVLKVRLNIDTPQMQTMANDYDLPAPEIQTLSF